MTEAERNGARTGRIVDASTTLFSPVGFTPDTLAEAREKKALGGQVIIVFGASPTGIGGAIAYEVALQGASVVTVSRNKADNTAAEEFAASLTEQTGTKAKWMPADITEKDAADKVIANVVNEFGRVDGVVIASGIRDDFYFIGMSRDRFMRVFDTNFIGPYFAIQAAFNQMRRQKPPSGRIVAIGSEAGEKGSPGQTNYAAAKAALAITIASIELETEWKYKPKNPELNLTVVNISPGVVRTGLTDDLSPEQKALLLRETGAERELEPSEVAILVAYALSREGGAILSGKTVPIVGKGPLIS